MSTTLTPSAARGTVTVPTGTDRVNIADLTTTMAQALLNRSEWAAKSLIDVKTGQNSAADADFASGASFATPTNGTLTFTDVTEDDKFILFGNSTWQCGNFTADGSDPRVDGRWLIGGSTDISLADSEYPSVMWGVSVGVTPQDFRQLSVLGSYTALADAASLTAAFQARVTGGLTLVMSSMMIIGVHFRLGAA